MKSIKPSQELTRRNSFKKEGQDVKFFEKVTFFQTICFTMIISSRVQDAFNDVPNGCLKNTFFSKTNAIAAVLLFPR